MPLETKQKGKYLIRGVGIFVAHHPLQMVVSLDLLTDLPELESHIEHKEAVNQLISDESLR